MLSRWNNFLVAVAVVSLNGAPALAQAAGGNQQIFQDEQQMMHSDSSQANQEQEQAQQYSTEIQQRDAAQEPFRQYAEKRIIELSKMRMNHGSPALSAANEKQLYALQQWLQKDGESRAQEQAHLKALDKSIANLYEQRNATFQNLGSDINNMRENQEQLAEDDRFNKMMRVNMFNELQSEMGAATWGGTPRDGTYNSVGGYGFQGGYGYSGGFGRGAGRL
jgi:hypothetical protein